MKILVSGASGFIGRWLIPGLRSQGYEVSLLVRRPAASPAEISWNPGVPPQVRDFDAVIHLAGETIMGRWTQAKKNRIRESRTVATRNLSLAVAEMRARTFLVASAIGYYGPRGDEILTEDSPPGSDFLAQVTRDWEAAAEPGARRACGWLISAMGWSSRPREERSNQCFCPSAWDWAAESVRESNG